MKHLPVVVLAFVCNLALAGDERMHLVHPKGNALALVSVTLERDTSAKFSGQAWVTGTLVARWPQGAANKAYKSPDYLLIPDAASVGKLPYFVLREPPYFNRYRVRTIDVLNGEAALRMAFNPKVADNLVHRKVNAIRITGAFLIKDYSVGVECDGPWARARIIKARIPEKLAQGRHGIPEGC